MGLDARRIARYALLAVVSVAGVFTRCHPGEWHPPPPPATMGAISVSHGFGAWSSTPYQCTGSGTLTASPYPYSNREDLLYAFDRFIVDTLSAESRSGERD